MTDNKTKKILRIVSEVTAILLFIFLLKNHKLQIWIGLFGLSALLSLAAGRFYCSWICPMNTGFRVLEKIYGKLKIKRRPLPKLFQNNVIRFVLTAVFAASMIITNRFGIKLNMLLYITVFSIILTLFLEEEFWHRTLCPFGAILSLSSRKAMYSLKINEKNCIACGKCRKVCPSGSIITLTNSKMRNIRNECLLCGNCTDVCPADACNFILEK